MTEGEGSPPTPDAGAPLDRLTSVEDILKLLCACARYGQPSIFGGGTDWHAATCPAGIFEYWTTRHPDAVAEWLAPYREGERSPPLLGW